MKVLVFDTETTGLPKFKNSSIYKTDEWPYIMQLSYITYDMDTDKLEIFDDYIRLHKDVEITKESIEVHGITRETCESRGIDINEALEKFIDNVKMSDILVAHNIAFDKRMVMVEGIRNKKLVNKKEIIEYCTMRCGADVCKIERISSDGEKYYKKPTLSELYQHYFKKMPQNTHNAIVDVLICLRCFMMMRYNLDISKVNRTFRSMIRKNT